MFLAHAPVGYLVGRALRRTGLPALVPVAIAGSLAPDLDLVPSYALHVHHHAFPTHWPLVLATACALLAPLLAVPRARTAAALGLVFAANGLLHQVLDSVVGDLRWLAPWSERPFALFHVSRTYEPWWVNFLVHPTFALELALLALAVAAATRRRPASDEP